MVHGIIFNKFLDVDGYGLYLLMNSKYSVYMLGIKLLGYLRFDIFYHLIYHSFILHVSYLSPKITSFPNQLPFILRLKPLLLFRGRVKRPNFDCEWQVIGHILRSKGYDK